MRQLKFIGALFVNVVVAGIGTALLESALFRVIPSRTISGYLWKEWILNPLCAAFIGFFMWRTWRSAAVLWVWTLPTLWFGVGLVGMLGRHDLWHLFSGVDCADGRHALGCRDFILFTLALLRGVSYSIGGALSRAVERKTTMTAAGV